MRHFHRPKAWLLAYLALAFSLAYVPRASADDHSTDLKQDTIGDYKGRRLLAEVPSMNTADAWYTTGLEDYYKSPKCVVARDLYVYTKPSKSSAGLWRGQKTYLSGQAKDLKDGDCNDVKLATKFTDGMATFIDPDKYHPDEAWDGMESGIFNVSKDIPDSVLLNIADSISQLHTCLKNKNCDYPIDTKDMMSRDHPYDYIPVIGKDKLIALSKSKENSGCYSMTFMYTDPYYRMIAADICYQDTKIMSVSLTDEILE